MSDDVNQTENDNAMDNPTDPYVDEPDRLRKKIKIGSQREGDDVDPSGQANAESIGTGYATYDGSGGAPTRDGSRRDELQQEIDAALGGMSIDEILAAETDGGSKATEPQVDARLRATVVKVHREDVFFTLPGRYEGVASLRQFKEAPDAGDVMDVVVKGYNTEDGIYELTIPGATVNVSDWSDIREGLTVEARVTGHNAGGLECDVNNLRGFMPISQIALYRVEDLDEFVDQKFQCIVTEANPDRRNLVLSRRAVLEREKQEAKEEILQSLEVGQTREGIVRKIMDFGAFVDIGGVDGLVHVSKMSWDRVNHPSEVFEEGQKVQVKVEKIDGSTGKISLSYRDLLEHPWQNISAKYEIGSMVSGTVSKIMDFGAFVRLEQGIEGLIHISELAHQRVHRVDSVVKEGQELTVKVLSVDAENQRMSLSLKAAQAAPQKHDPTEEEAAEESPPRELAVKSRNSPLKGGTNKRSGGDQFGLKW